MGNRTFAPITILIAAFALMASALGSAVAQDATPAADGYFATHPAHIHSGTCDTLGDVVFPLTDVQSTDLAVSTYATPADAPGATPPPALASTPVITTGQSTTLEVALDDILAAEHAINVHQSAEDIATYIACGDITGPATDGVVTVELMELDDSGYVGRASLTDNGDGTTTVTIDLIYSEAATPAA
jgi:hypothetical protein